MGAAIPVALSLALAIRDAVPGGEAGEDEVGAIAMVVRTGSFVVSDEITPDDEVRVVPFALSLSLLSSTRALGVTWLERLMLGMPGRGSGLPDEDEKYGRGRLDDFRLARERSRPSDRRRARRFQRPEGNWREGKPGKGDWERSRQGRQCVTWPQRNGVVPSKRGCVLPSPPPYRHPDLALHLLLFARIGNLSSLSSSLPSVSAVRGLPQPGTTEDALEQWIAKVRRFVGGWRQEECRQHGGDGGEVR